jgi:hypothetical protein
VKPFSVQDNIAAAVGESLNAKGIVMLTRTGQIITPLEPDPIDIDEVAYVLSRFGRYGCHAPEPYPEGTYTVGQHSLFMMDLMRRRGFSGVLQREALLHDAHETYFGDWPKPIKLKVSQLGEVEAVVEAQVRQALNLLPKMPQVVKQADYEALQAEMYYLWASQWPDDKDAREALRRVMPLTPYRTEDLFRAAYYRLTPDEA